MPTGLVVKNGWNSLGSSSGVTPGPSSCTSSRTFLPASNTRIRMRPRLRRRGLDRLLGVDDEVERHLLDLGEVRVHLARRQRLDVERDRRVIEIAPAKLDHLRDDLAQIDERRRPGLLAAESRQVADDFARAAALDLDERDFLERFGGQFAMTLEQLGGAEDRLQRIVQLVRDAGDEHADRGQPLLAHHLALQRLQRLAHLPLLLRPDDPGRYALREGSRPS